MTTQDDEIAKKITTYLDHGTAELKAGTAYRLQQARSAALAKLAAPARGAVRASAHALAGTGTGSGDGSRPFYAQLRFWFGVALIAAAGYGYQQWQAYQEAKEFADLDSQILSSDLPIDAYLDRGFQNWIKTGFVE